MSDLAHEYISHARLGATRCDFLILTSGSLGAVAAGATVWPVIDTMNPAHDTLAASTAELDLAPVAVGQRLTVAWRGKPVLIDHRPPAEVKAAPDFDISVPKLVLTPGVW